MDLYNIEMGLFLFIVRDVIGGIGVGLLFLWIVYKFFGWDGGRV